MKVLCQPLQMKGRRVLTDASVAVVVSVLPHQGV